MGFWRRVTEWEKRVRKVWRYQRGNQNPYIEDEQTTQWPKGKVQKGKQRSTKHTYKAKDRVTRTSIITGGELRCSGRVFITSTYDLHMFLWSQSPARHSFFVHDNVPNVASISGWSIVDCSFCIFLRFMYSPNKTCNPIFLT